MWVLPGSGIHPGSPAFAGGFLTAVPPEKFSWSHTCYLRLKASSLIVLICSCQRPPQPSASWVSSPRDFCVLGMALSIFRLEFPSGWGPSRYTYLLADRSAQRKAILSLICREWRTGEQSYSMDCSPPGSSVHGISQARILEGVAISFFRKSSQSRDQTQVSCTGRWILYCWPTGAGQMQNKNLEPLIQKL